MGVGVHLVRDDEVGAELLRHDRVQRVGYAAPRLPEVVAHLDGEHAVVRAAKALPVLAEDVFTGRAEHPRVLLHYVLPGLAAVEALVEPMVLGGKQDFTHLCERERRREVVRRSGRGLPSGAGVRGDEHLAFRARSNDPLRIADGEDELGFDLRTEVAHGPGLAAVRADGDRSARSVTDEDHLVLGYLRVWPGEHDGLNIRRSHSRALVARFRPGLAAIAAGPQPGVCGRDTGEDRAVLPGCHRDGAGRLERREVAFEEAPLPGVGIELVKTRAVHDCVDHCRFPSGRDLDHAIAFAEIETFVECFPADEAGRVEGVASDREGEQQVNEWPSESSHRGQTPVVKRTGTRRNVAEYEERSPICFNGTETLGNIHRSEAGNGKDTQTDPD